MNKILKNILLIFSIFVLTSCSNEQEERLKAKVNEEIKVEAQYKRGKKAKVAAAQYAEMEHSLNHRFVNDLSSMIENSFEKQLEEFEDEELGFWSNIGYAWGYYFKDEQKWADELSLKSDKYFNVLDIKQEAFEMYRKHIAEIQKLRSSFYTNKKSVTMPENIYLELPKETLDLNKMKDHTFKNIVIERSSEFLGWGLAAIIGVFVPVVGWIADVVIIPVSIYFSIKNDNKMIDSLREQHTDITLDYESILNDLDKNTIKFYEKYK